MASLPADEDYARSVLAIFGARHVHARQSLPASDVEADFLAHNMGRQADFEAALEYATSQGWLALGLDRIRLTDQEPRRWRRSPGLSAASIPSAAAIEMRPSLRAPTC
jgi:hypothetical protein